MKINFTSKSNAVSELYPITPAGLKDEQPVPPVEKVSTPTASCENNVVTMSCTTTGATILYKAGETAEYSTYSTPITISETTQFKAYATKEGMENSDELSFTAEYVEPVEPVEQPNE